MAKKIQKTENLRPTSEAGAREYARFQADYKKQLERVKEEVALTIMVWGPGKKSKSPVGPKRWEIYEALKDLGHNAVASEDLSGLTFTAGLSEASKEFAQAKAAHLVLVLIEEAPGALAETHDFASDPELASKFYVFVPTKYKEGYSGKGVIHDLDKGWHGVYWYEDDEVPACNILTEAVEWVETRRQVEYRRRRSYA